ncbi:hypothetical protein ACIA3K_03990 [Micromonospora sp. NPDC051543]|uniref:hypothetical protein n=1 Tax=Micromonospora sp. NPDC051543 TaxID=3364287 RepID=UPI00378AE6EE
MRTNVHPTGSPTDRLAAVGNQMIEIHLWLRTELARLRADLDTPSRDLRAHCLTFCAALSRTSAAHATWSARDHRPSSAAGAPGSRS